MSIFGGIGNIMNTASNLVTAVATGDLKGALMAAAQIGLMYMTGGSSALLTGAIQQGIAQFGGQAMAQALGKELVSMMGQELIQKLGTEMGLPQPMIDAAQAAFCKECGDMQGYKSNHFEAGNGRHINRGEELSSKAFLQHILNGFDASPAQRGNAERAFDGVQTMIEGLLRDIMEEGKNSSKDKKSAGRSWIAAMAETLGKVLDKAWGEVETKIDRITEVSNKGKEDRGKLMPSATAEFQGAMAEFNMIMQAVTTAIKTAGEASASMTRKQ